MFTPIQKILPKAIQGLGLRRETEAALICEKYRKIAPRLVHANALRYTYPKFYRGRTLMVGVTNPAWAEQIMIRKAELMKAINESLGKKLIQTIKTQIVEKI